MFDQDTSANLNELVAAFSNPIDDAHERYLAEAILKQSDYGRNDQEIIDYNGEEYLSQIKLWWADNKFVLEKASSIVNPESVTYTVSDI